MAFWLDVEATLLAPDLTVSSTTPLCVSCLSCPCLFYLDFQVTEMWEMRLRQGGHSRPLLHCILVTKCHQADPLCASVHSCPHSLLHGRFASR